MLTRSQIKAREGRLTASRIGILANGAPEKIYELWEEMTGQREPEDLSHIWAVRLGECTEVLSLDWYEHRIARTLTRRGEVVVSPRATWAACTLDGFDAALVGPVEVKHVGGFEPREKIVARYMPQIHWQMLCTETDKCVLSIIEGAREPAHEPITFDRAFADELWARAEAFMQCVNDLVPPVELTPMVAPVPQEQWREADMAGSNSWTAFAGQWLDNRDAAKLHESASKELKALVDPDVGRAHGAGLQCKRAKNGALTISLLKG